MKTRRVVVSVLALAGVIASAPSTRAQGSGTALVRHAPTVNGVINGSIRQMLGEGVTLSTGASVSGDLLVPGTPVVNLIGSPNYTGTIDGVGASAPSNYQIVLNGTARLRRVVRRTDPLPLPVVSAPPLPIGTRSVTISLPGGSAGDFATLRDLALNSNVGQYAIPAGTYGDFSASGGSGFILGVAGATQPAVYHFQRLTVNWQARVQAAGPVVITVANGLVLGGSVGSPASPERVTLNIFSGGLTLNTGATCSGTVNAPNGAVVVYSNTQLTGGLACDQLIVNSNGFMRILPANQPSPPALPYFTSFEAADGYTPGPLAGQVDWTTSGMVSVSASTPFQGVHSLLFSAGSVAPQAVRAFAGSGAQPVVFTDIFSKPAAGTAPSSSVMLQGGAGKVAFVQSGPLGEIHVFNGNGAGGGTWQGTGFKIALAAGGQAAAWLRITLREDYTAKRWDLFANGQAVACELGFADNAVAAFGQFSLSSLSSASSVFDEFYAGFDNPLFADADRDGMEDAWEVLNGLNPALNDRSGDRDADGLVNIREFQLGTRANLADTDGDALPDGWEAAKGTNPLVGDGGTDADADGLSNFMEFLLGTNPLQPAPPDTTGALKLRLYKPGR